MEDETDLADLSRMTTCDVSETSDCLDTSINITHLKSSGSLLDGEEGARETQVHVVAEAHDGTHR